MEELNQRIHESNLSDKEKLISIKYQNKVHPNGIEPVGSDALRLALLVQDFKCNFTLKKKKMLCDFRLSINIFSSFIAESINLDMYLFTDSKRYCNKIWNAVNYFQLFHSDKQKDFKLLTLDQVLIY